MNNALRFGGWLRSEIEERRVWVLVAVVMLAVAWVTWVYNPAKVVENEFVEPVSEALGVPVSPGGFNVLGFCEKATSVTGGEDVHIGGNRYIAQTSLELVDWPDAPIGKNHIATYYTKRDSEPKRRRGLFIPTSPSRLLARQRSPS